MRMDEKKPSAVRKMDRGERRENKKKR